MFPSVPLQELIEKRRKLLSQFEELRDKLRETYLAEKEARKQLRGFVDTDELDEGLEEEVVEFVIKEEITVCEWSTPWPHLVNPRGEIYAWGKLYYLFIERSVIVPLLNTDSCPYLRIYSLYFHTSLIAPVENTGSQIDSTPHFYYYYII